MEKDKEKSPTPTERQGQFLAYIFQYSLLNGCAPAEADMQRFFRLTPPSVHSMVLTFGFRESIHLCDIRLPIPTSDVVAAEVGIDC